jgi:lipid A 3-O-deacylase
MKWRPVLSAAWLSMALIGPAAAGDGHATWLPDRVFAQIGIADAARSTVIGANWAPLLERSWIGGQTDVFWEASFGRWKGEASPIHPHAQWFTQVGLTPVLRWQLADDTGWFLEAGIGANVIFPTYSRQRKRFSTAFNFGDHIGVGLRFGESHQHELALRVQHFSNGGIRLPNPGENFRQLRYTWTL